MSTAVLDIPGGEPIPYTLERSEIYQVHNRWLRLTVAGLAAALVVSLAANWHLSRAQARLKPIVVRIDNAGVPSAAPYEAAEYKPQAAEIRYFLSNFLSDHFGRERVVARDAFTRKLYFMSAPLAHAEIEQAKRDRYPDQFLASPDDEIGIEIDNIAVADLRAVPYKAIAEFQKVFRAAADRREIRREKWLANLVIEVLPPTQNASFLQVNPLGLVVTYYRADKGF